MFGLPECPRNERDFERIQKFELDAMMLYIEVVGPQNGEHLSMWKALSRMEVALGLPTDPKMNYFERLTAIWIQEYVDSFDSLDELKRDLEAQYKIKNTENNAHD